jgi:predicted membrane chloride channel (bestrophin family)
MAFQSKELSEAYANGEINDFQWTQINQQLVKFTDNQGKAERIKNFPIREIFRRLQPIFCCCLSFLFLSDF